jgi:hypothetical protein
MDNMLQSENILKTKRMLTEGWRIKEYHFSYNVKPHEERMHVVLEKGEKTSYIDAMNDGPFVEYIFHFEKFQDQFGNFEFIYIDDIKGYKQRMEQENGKGAVPKRPYKISIGDKLLDEAHLDYYRPPGRKPVGEFVGIACFFVRFEKNPSFGSTDFREEIKILWTDTGELAFTGFVHEAYVGEDSAVLRCYGSNRRFFQETITSECVGVKGIDFLYFVSNVGGFEMNIHGKDQPLLFTRDFIVIFPINSLVTPCDFSIEQVRFTKNIANLLADRIKRAKTLSKNPWNSATTYAVTIVEANHYFEAFKN